MSSLSISSPSREAPRRVSRAAVVVHGGRGLLGDARRRVEQAAQEAGVELVEVGAEEADVVIALGGDGTMLRALRATMPAPTPVFGIRFGRVGFLTSIEGSQLERGLERVFAGDYRVVELATLKVALADGAHAAINDVVTTSSVPGRMVELGWKIGGEDLGSQPCDGMICCTPTGSTAYNLSNGGPVMMWGLAAMAITFVAPHSLHARPLVVPRGLGLTIMNRSGDVRVAVLVDGRKIGEVEPSAAIEVGVGDEACLLALLPEVTFFTRYHAVFT